MVNIAIIGATGAVGKELVKCLFDEKIKVNKLKLLASVRSAGTKINTYFGEITIEEVNNSSFEGINFAFFCAGGNVSKKWAKIAIKAGTIVIDNTSAFRYDSEVPLIVPEINAFDIGDAKLIANPNCTTAIASVAMYPIHKKYKIKKAIISTYQATSGAGAEGMEELLKNTKAYLEGKIKQNKMFVYPIEFNLIPHIDSFEENFYTREEMKVVWETKKIFHDEDIKISCTAVRIPTLRAHSESIVLETEHDIEPEEVKQLMKQSPGVELVDDIQNNHYPMPLTASKKYDVEVGRIRQSLVFGKKGIELFISGDQILKGAALNAVQIMQEIFKKYNFNY